MNYFVKKWKSSLKGIAIPNFRTTLASASKFKQIDY